jgi:transcriptional regulator with XRE-family HTH domain
MPAVPWLSQKAYVTLGQSLAEIRRQAGVTQDELAARLRKPQSFVSAYERGQRRVDLLEFLAIADALVQDPQEAFAAVLLALRPSASSVRRPTSR